MSRLCQSSSAPGFILRHTGLEEAIGANPSPADSIAYAIVALSVGGILPGIVWVRMKNLVAVLIIHAAVNLLPNFAQFAKTFRELATSKLLATFDRS